MKVIAPITVIAVLICAGVAAADLVFPLRGPKILTAVFGEYRINHPHGGIDLGTQGKIGAPVPAAASGRVVRLRASAFGYGKSVYVAHRDGSVTVYAHLSEFAPKIDAVARRIQENRGMYGFDRHFSGDGPVLQSGEILGYAGMTGTDVPHLHFEVRHGGLPVNPLVNGISLPDAIAPKIEKLYVKPIAADARVGDSFDTAFFDFDENGRIGETVGVCGRVEFAAQITDYIDGSPRPLAPYKVFFEIDGRRVYGLGLDRFNYADTAVSELVYNYEFKEEKLGTFMRLRRHSIKTVFHTDNLRGETADLGPGEHQARITAYDAAGNIGSGEFSFTVQAPVKRLTPPGASGEKVILPPQAVSFTEDVLRVKLPEDMVAKNISAAGLNTASGKTLLPTLYRAADQSVELLFDWPTSYQGKAAVSWQAGDSARSADLFIQSVRDSITLTSPDNKAKIEIPKGALFKAFPVAASAQAAPPDKDLEAVSPLYTFNRPWEPIRRKLQVSIAPDKGTQDRRKIGLYLYDRGTYWHLGNGTGAKATHLGSFALMKDISPPVIGDASVEKIRGRQVLVVSYEEKGSGAPGEGASVWIDGKRVIAELMPVVGKVRYIPAIAFTPGAHAARMRIVDRAGNSDMKEFSFTIE